MSKQNSNIFLLDLRGEPCPYPVVFSLDTLSRLDKGSIVEILADCPQSFISVPEEVIKAGYELLEPPQKVGPTLRFLVKIPG
ncbi:sulfurtransferase-like selenium metabolism protein YedF [bacterium BFN5]|nr:sulfurtransferase-like selenium metabolism protein YedF [bacterium BFN5]QJW47869.1 sulfurtransferase-like selenium metabolism protein YedF [bacterium BFN5]